MKKIIAPVDFSEVSLNTALYAANVAALLNKELELLHITELPAAYAEFIPEAIGEYHLTEHTSAAFAKLVDDIKAKLTVKITITTTNINGSPLYEITNYCNQQMPYAIVISTHSDSALSRLLLGSTTFGVIKSCHSPVIIVPNSYTYQKPVKIGLASDFHEMEQSIPSALIRTIVEDFGASLEILHVDNFEPEDVLAAGSEHVSTLFNFAHPKVKILKSAFTEEALLNYSAVKQLDMLVVVPRKHSWVELLTKHQHTKNIALNAPVPVLVVK